MSPQSLIGNLKKNRHEGFKKLLLFLKKKIVKNLENDMNFTLLFTEYSTNPYEILDLS